MKHFYYIANAIAWLIPHFIFRSKAKKILAHYNKNKDPYIEDRVSYYNKLDKPFSLPESENEGIKKVDIARTLKIKNFKKVDGTTYYFDILDVIKYFPKEYKLRYMAGDVTHVADIPTIVKSRPIKANNNSVLLKLNKVRHFNFVNDSLAFEEKKDMVVWRGANSHQHPHRDIAVKQFYNHPLCNIGQTSPKEDQPWVKGFLSIEAQLQYKFILSIEGNDVATNLKWIMSSNSVCIMPKPKYETWFMEGRLEAGKHYVEVKDDYSDLIEKMEYYLSHPEEAKALIKNANDWCNQFKNKERELLISLLVADKYFSLSN